MIRFGAKRLRAETTSSVGNAAWIALPRACGSGLTGTFQAIGFKHGRWVDSVLMQRALGPGSTTTPNEKV